MYYEKFLLNHFGFHVVAKVYDDDTTLGFTGTIEGRDAFARILTEQSAADHKEEIKRYMRAHILGLSPEVYATGYTENTAVIITDLCDESLSNKIRELVESSDTIPRFKKAISDIIRLDESIFKMCLKSVEGGIPHGDLHADNIMLKGNRIYFIDWEDYTDADCEKYAFTKKLVGTVYFTTSDSGIQELSQKYLRKLDDM